MNPAFRRLLALAVVFLAAFVAVTALRTWRSGGDLRDLLPGWSKGSDQFRREVGTPATRPPLDLKDVELLSRLNDEYAKLTEAVVPSRILSSACCTPSPETSRVIDGFSLLRAILSTSSM